MDSIISTEKECYFCGRRTWIECHHIYGGANRKLSEKYGLKVYLCHYCHNEPPNGVHHNRERAEILREIGQKAFNLNYPNKDFIKIFGRNFIK